MTHSWTDEAQIAIDLCNDWAAHVVKDMPAKIFLFGSAIYNGGEQFFSDQSDLDIVVLFTDQLAAPERIKAVRKLLKHKADLELKMIPRLQRTSCDEPGVSIVPITRFELQANVHKSGARRFFTRNYYLNLLNGDHTLGIDGAGTLSIDDEHRYALEYVQKIRNEFLSVSANGTGSLKAYAGTDPMPKALLRVAAQQLKDVPDGAWYDTRLGLEELHRKLGDLRTEDPLFNETYKVVSVRRGGRGQRKPLTALDQLVLAEILFEDGFNAQTSPIVTWMLRVTGVAFAKPEWQRILSALIRLVPGAELLNLRAGSIVFEMRSDKEGYEILRRLRDLNVLHTLLGVHACELGESKDLDSPVDLTQNRQDVESRLLAKIAEWRPDASLSPRMLDVDFTKFLRNLHTSNTLPELDFDEGVVVDGPRPYVIDFVAKWLEPGGAWEELPIEVSFVSTPAVFFRKLERLLMLNMQVVLVCVTPPKLQHRLEQDVRRLNNETRKVTVIFVTPAPHGESAAE